MNSPTAAVVAPDAPLREVLEAPYVADFRSPWRTPSGLVEALEDFQPDLVAAHTSHAHAHAVRLARCPVIVHRRLDFRVRRRSWLKYRAVRGFVAVSHAVSEVLRAGGVPRERIAVVHDGVVPPVGRPRRARLCRALGIPEASILVLAVGALVPHKGHRYLVDAIEELPERYHALIAGMGPLGERLQGHPRVHLLGQRTDVGSLLQSCDLFCHPSVEEGMGQVVAEALMTPTRVVATRAGGVPEVVRKDGVLVEPGCGVALAVGILEARGRAVHDPGRARREFAVERMVRGTEAAYRHFAGQL